MITIDVTCVKKSRIAKRSRYRIVIKDPQRLVDLKMSCDQGVASGAERIEAFSVARNDALRMLSEIVARIPDGHFQFTSDGEPVDIDYIKTMGVPA